MNKDLNSDKRMREKLAGFSVQPPAHVWDNVQGKLAAQQKRKRIAYFGWISAAAVVLFAILAGWYFNNSSEIVTPLAVEQQTIQPEKSEKSIVQNEKDLNAELTDNQQIQNEKIQIEEIDEKLQKTVNPLIAATIKSEDNKEIIPAPLNYKRVEMKTIKRKDVQFENRQIEMFLAEKSVSQKEYVLTDTDRFLMAANATSTKSKNKPKTGWKIGIGVTPGYSSHVANHSDSYSKNMTYSNESSNGNMGGGFSIQYKTGKKLRIESGIYYAQNGQKSESLFQVFAKRENVDYAMDTPLRAIASNAVNLDNGNVAMNSTAGVIVMSTTPKGTEINSKLDGYNSLYSNSLVSNGEFSQVFDFVEIPLYLRYRVVDSKFGIELVGGVNAGIIVGNNAYIDNSYGLQNIGKTEDISTVSLSGTVGVGMNYALGKHISVAVEPRMNYYFTSINNNPEVDFRPYRIGIFTGLYYEF